MLRLAGEDRLLHFSVDLDRMPTAAKFVLGVIRRNYPSLDIPFHARWRHFCVGGLDRWGSAVHNTSWTSRAARARAAFDLAIVSVLLDAGAGSAWCYRE